MPTYNIPSEVKDGIVALSSLELNQVDKLIESFENLKVGDGIEDTTNSLISKSNIADSTAYQIVGSLFSMVGIFEKSKNTIEDFSEVFINDLNYQHKDVINEDTRAILKIHFHKIFPFFSIIRHTQKAKNVIVQNQNNFKEARIISDIRIAYDELEELNKIEQYAVIVHHLKINYFNPSNPEMETHFSLDYSDLIKLQKVVNRAIEKNELLKTNNHQLTFVELK